MKLTITTPDDRFLLLDIAESDIVENLKAILEVETSIPIANQKLLYNGKELKDFVVISVQGVVDGDLLELRTAAPSAAPPVAPSNILDFNPDGTAKNPEALIDYLSRNLPLLSNQHPALYEAVLRRDAAHLQRILAALHEEKKWRDRLSNDPFDTEAQLKIEESIRRANIAENEALAMEYNPAQFSSVFMLYVVMEVNNVPLKTFIDSGAQMSIMSQACAERCGIMRLCDQRYSGYAMGVGKDKIVGRIHNVQLKIGPHFYMCGITVLENPRLEFIFGLDLLRRHQCSIDLKKNVLKVGTDDLEVAFLPEHEVPRIDTSGVEGEETTPSAQVPAPAAPSQPSVPSIQPQSQPQPFQSQSSSTAPLSATTAPSGSSAAPVVQAGPDSNAGVATISGAVMSEEKIMRLVELGFDRATVIKVLQLCNGNEDAAAGVLFGG